MSISLLLLFLSSRFFFLTLAHTFQIITKYSQCCNRYGNQPPERYQTSNLPLRILNLVSKSLKPSLFALPPSKRENGVAFYGYLENGNHMCTLGPTSPYNRSPKRRDLLQLYTRKRVFATVFLLGTTRDIKTSTTSWYWAVTYHMWVIPRACPRLSLKSGMK